MENSTIAKFLNPILITVAGVLIWNAYHTMSQAVDILNDRFSAQAERITKAEGRIDGVGDRITNIDGRITSIDNRLSIFSRSGATNAYGQPTYSMQPMAK